MVSLKKGHPGVLSTQICMCAYDHGEIKIKIVANFQKQKMSSLHCKMITITSYRKCNVKK